MSSGSPTVPRGSPVSVYLFPGEAPKVRPSPAEGEESDLDGPVATASEAQADMMTEDGSEGSTDNDDFCILEAPGMGILVSQTSCQAIDPFTLVKLLLLLNSDDIQYFGMCTHFGNRYYGGVYYFIQLCTGISHQNVGILPR